jgi:hypothetical protein
MALSYPVRLPYNNALNFRRPGGHLIMAGRCVRAAAQLPVVDMAA